MIHFVSGGRQFGKTTRMIREAAEQFSYIIVPDHQQARHVADMAEQMGLQIPFPVTWREFVRGEYNALGVRGFVIDNLDQCLQGMTTVPIVAASIPAVDQIRPNSPSSRADFAPRGEDAPSALSRDTATAEGVSKLPAPDAGGSS